MRIPRHDSEEITIKVLFNNPGFELASSGLVSRHSSPQL